MKKNTMKLIECPRDAMQGIHDFIPTRKKIDYINAILKAGFDTVDFGSFVSPKAIPQLRDTAEVLAGLHFPAGNTRLLAIIANLRGAEDACHFEEITYLGFPFSISETFQMRNTNSSITESLKRVEDIQQLCVQHRKELVVYLSMAFGNPYGDEWSSEIAINWTSRLAAMGIRILSLADTTGVSNPENISYLFKNIIPEFRDIEIGAHLHTTPETWEEKMEAAWASGCRRYDSAIKGFGGCPMAADQLTGNMPTEHVLAFMKAKGLKTGIDEAAFTNAMDLAMSTFPQ
ncbi:MAG TPA: hydroxymethylglutaryl-CoA lyase [Bacteroidia bacterium]|jgi:hydroxymethylglutaryl-CoA lyase|nr:hydroxymethylglutaryl-CoA lyase [Bacteroidia bacterium]